MNTNFDDISNLASNDVKVLEHKAKTYGDSWCKRGGVGAFMMLARKWDRIENQCKHESYDIFKAGEDSVNVRDGLLDDIADLRRYLLLVEERVRAEYSACSPPSMDEHL